MKRWVVIGMVLSSIIGGATAAVISGAMTESREGQKRKAGLCLTLEKGRPYPDRAFLYQRCHKDQALGQCPVCQEVLRERGELQ